MLRTPRQMHGRRALAAAAAAGLLVSLFAPWYRETVVAPGLTGLRTLTLTRSGWQAFSATELLIVIVAVLTLVVVSAMPKDEPADGAPDRLRLSGAIVAALGAIAFVVVLARLTTAPGTTKHALDETMVAIRWGIFLALACSAALTVAGLRLLRAPRELARTPRAERAPRRERVSRTDRPPREQRAPRKQRAPRQERPPRHIPRADRAPRADRTPQPDRGQPSPARTDGSGPSAAPPNRRADRTWPSRRAERPLWDEQATGWLDLPD